MEFSDMLIIVNLAGLMILGFVGWTQIKAAKMQILDIVNRDLAEVRRQMRQTLKHANRQDDQIADNHEKILMIEVNMASMQDELEKIGRKLDKFVETSAFGTVEHEQAESEIVPDSEKRHLYE